MGTDVNASSPCHHGVHASTLNTYYIDMAFTGPQASTCSSFRDLTRPSTTTLCPPLFHPQGSLYLDDGSTFAFQSGAYLHRAFSFKGMALSSTPHVETGVPSGSMGSALTIERVVFMGLPAGKRFGAKVRRVTVCCAALILLCCHPTSAHGMHTVF